MIARKYRWTKCPKDLEKRVKILVLNWILQLEGLRFSQDSFTLVLAYPLPGERSPMAVVDQVSKRSREKSKNFGIKLDTAT